MYLDIASLFPSFHFSNRAQVPNWELRAGWRVAGCLPDISLFSFVLPKLKITEVESFGERSTSEREAKWESLWKDYSKQSLNKTISLDQKQKGILRIRGTSALLPGRAQTQRGDEHTKGQSEVLPNLTTIPQPPCVEGEQQPRAWRDGETGRMCISMATSVVWWLTARRCWGVRARTGGWGTLPTPGARKRPVWVGMGELWEL